MTQAYCKFCATLILLIYTTFGGHAMRWRVRAKLTRDVAVTASRALRDDTPAAGTRPSVTIYLRSGVSSKYFDEKMPLTKDDKKIKPMKSPNIYDWTANPSRKAVTSKYFDSATVKFVAKASHLKMAKNRGSAKENEIIATTISTTTPTMTTTTQKNITVTTKKLFTNTVADWAASGWRRPPAAVLDMFSRSFNLSELLAWRRIIGNEKENLTTTLATPSSTATTTSMIILSTTTSDQTPVTKHNDVNNSQIALNNFLSLDALLPSPGGRRTRPPVGSLRAAFVGGIKRLMADGAAAFRTADWRLYNHCAGGYLAARTFDAGAGGWAHARGRVGQKCLVDWRVHFWSDGTLSLESLARRRRRLLLCAGVGRSSHHFILRKWTIKDEREARCRFREHFTHSGYSLLDSAATTDRRLRLGFDQRGRLLAAGGPRRCFHFSRVDVDPSAAEQCRPATLTSEAVDKVMAATSSRNQNQGWLREIARDALLRHIEI